MKKGILFDLDGTLWDTGENVAAAWNKVLSDKYPEIGKSVTLSEVYGYMGKTPEQIENLMFPELSPDMRHKVMSDCFGYENEYLSEHGGKLFPNVKETLERLKEQYNLFIVSNCQSGYIECFLEFSRLSYLFDDFECPGGTGLGKGKNNKIVISRNNIDKAVYVGDTQGDLDSADFAGIPFVFAKYGFGSVNRITESISKFGELPFIAQKLLG
jgi:phosphoglycolate phosphatase